MRPSLRGLLPSLILWGVLPAQAGAAPGAPVPATGRDWGDVERVVDAVESALAEEAADPSSWREFRRRLRSRVPYRWRDAILDRGLLADEPEDRAVFIDDLRARVHRLAAACREPSRLPADGRADPAQVLRGVLERPEFRRAHREPGFWERVIGWVMDLVRSVLGFIFRHRTATYIISRIILLGVYLGLCVLLIYFLQRAVRDRRVAGDDGPSIFAKSLDDAARPPEDILAEGDRRLEAGAWLEALAAYRLYVLLLLDRRKLLAYSPSGYHREFVAQLRRSGAGAEAVGGLRGILNHFDRHRYGRAVSDRSGCREYRDDVTRYAASVARDAGMQP